MKIGYGSGGIRLSAGTWHWGISAGSGLRYPRGGRRPGIVRPTRLEGQDALIELSMNDLSHAQSICRDREAWVGSAAGWKKRSIDYV